MTLISKIFHISDIHLRLYKRHAEYQQVFNRLYQFIDKNKDSDSVIFLGGDIVHNKNEMSPELIEMVSDLLFQCAQRCPTIVICGNHDATLNNLNRLDALSPIVKALNHSNLFYWRDNGVYSLPNYPDVKFSVFSQFVNSSEWTLAKSIRSKYKIALCHAAVNGAVTDTGYEIGTRHVDVGMFDGFDLALLGDIHQYQYLNYGQTIAYPGSLVQQSFGEDVSGHGVLVWNVKTKRSEFEQIENDYCYHTLRVEDGRFWMPANISKKVRLRVKYENTSVERINQIIDEFSKEYQIVELSKQKIKTSSNKFGHSQSIGNSRDVMYQNECIGEYLDTTTSVSDDDLNKVFELNRQYNLKIVDKYGNKNIVWTPKKLEFSNMFSYGDDNRVDFSNFSGVYGVFGPNAQGKSALFDILCFALYDKTTRTSKGVHILNNKRTDFKCKFEFEHNGSHYEIERIGKKNDKGAVRVDVNFWIIDKDGRTLLNGIDRDSTNKIIREYVGQYDDFIMTALSSQYDNQSFVDRTQKERKDLLYKFLDITIYDELYRLAKDDVKLLQLTCRDLDSQDLFNNRSLLSRTTDKLRKDAISISDELVATDLKIEQCSQNIKDNSLKIQTIDASIDYNLKTIETNLITFASKFKTIQGDIDLLRLNLVGIDKSLESIDEPVLKSDTDLVQKYNSLKQINRDLQHSITSHNHQIELLNGHEYDPDCEYCIKNPFVKNATESQSILPGLLSRLNINKLELINIESKIETIKQNNIAYHSFRIIVQNKMSELRDIELLESKLETTQKDLDKWEDLKRKFVLNQSKIEINDIAKYEINRLENERRKLQEVRKNLEFNCSTIQSKILFNEKEISVLSDKIERYNKILSEIKINELYLQSIARDAVPYLILEKVLPLIEYEVNTILADIVNFTVKIESTDDKYVIAQIQYGDGDSWPVELTSGMERFMLSCAFRTALTEITSLPRPTFLAIDEGFGVLDLQNLQMLGKFFDILRNRYEYLLIISHIESMRDLPDKIIDIEKYNGFSKIWS